MRALKSFQKYSCLPYATTKTFFFVAVGIFLLSAPTQVCAQTQWSKYDANPVLEVGPAGSWDGESVLPASVLFDGFTYHMWYAGGDGSIQRGAGYATSDNRVDWTKHADNPLLEPGPAGSWDVWFAPSSVLFSNTTYKMWYWSYNGSKAQIGYATSPDGINWTKYGQDPVLDVGSQGSWDDQAAFYPWVVFDGTTYHMWYHGTRDFLSVRIGYATSPDGIDWTKYAGNPVLDVGPTGSWDGPAVGFPRVLFDGTTYQMWYCGGEHPRERIGYATSPDGVNWTKYAGNPVLDQGPAGSWDDAGLESGAVLFDGTIYHYWYGGGDGSLWRIGYATSLKGLQAFTAAPGYAVPGSDTLLVRADFIGDTTGLGFFARIKAPDLTLIDSLGLYDDGTHHDGESGDSLFGNIWQVPAAAEQTYLVGLQATLGDMEIIRYRDLARFTTIGPVALHSCTTPYHPDPPKSGDAIFFALSLRNEGPTATATDVSAVVTPENDTLVTTLAGSEFSFGDIAPGDTTDIIYYSVTFSENTPGDSDFCFYISITSEGYAFWSDSFSIHIDHPVEVADEKGALPTEYALRPAYPNPFNPLSTIRYDLPKGSEISLIVYDILGREITRLLDGYMEPGYHQVQWDSRNSQGRELPSSIYIARLVTPEYSNSIKMLLLK